MSQSVGVDVTIERVGTEEKAWEIAYGMQSIVPCDDGGPTVLEIETETGHRAWEVGSYGEQTAYGDYGQEVLEELRAMVERIEPRATIRVDVSWLEQAPVTTYVWEPEKER
jgi:hypothetical protein